MSVSREIDLQGSGKKKEPKPKLFGPDIFGWGGGLSHEGVGAKKLDMSFEAQGNQTFWRDNSGSLPGYRGFPKSLRLAVARGLLQGRPLQLPMGWGVGEESTKSWSTFEQLSVQNLALAISYCFLLPRARTKSGWPEVDQELDNGWPTFDTNISVLKLEGSFLQ